MDQREYEYRGLKASLWDLLRGDPSAWPDRPFYRRAIAGGGQPALDVACGTGRLLLDFLAAGIDIDGVDISPEMLALCRAEGQRLGLQPLLFQQAMEELALPRRYRTIIVPSVSIQVLTDPGAVAQAMERFAGHLVSGGTLVMSFMIRRVGAAPGTVEIDDWKILGEGVRPDDGAVVRRWSRSTYDTAAQLEHTEDRYELVRDEVVAAVEAYVRSPALRWYTQDQAADLYRAAGFADIRLVRDFTDQPARPDDQIFCVFGTRP